MLIGPTAQQVLFLDKGDYDRILDNVRTARQQQMERESLSGLSPESFVWPQARLIHVGPGLGLYRLDLDSGPDTAPIPSADAQYVQDKRQADLCDQVNHLERSHKVNLSEMPLVWKNSTSRVRTADVFYCTWHSGKPNDNIKYNDPDTSGKEHDLLYPNQVSPFPISAAEAELVKLNIFLEIRVWNLSDYLVNALNAYDSGVFEQLHDAATSNSGRVPMRTTIRFSSFERISLYEFKDICHPDDKFYNNDQTINVSRQISFFGELGRPTANQQSNQLWLSFELHKKQ